MSAKTRKPNELDKLVTKRDLWRVIQAMNEATRALESRIEALEKDGPGRPLLPDGGYIHAERIAGMGND